MSVRKIYTCNICMVKIKDPSSCFGIHFSNYKNFTLGGYETTDSVHICVECAIQLRKGLTGELVTSDLEIYAANEKARQAKGQE